MVMVMGDGGGDEGEDDGEGEAGAEAEADSAREDAHGVRREGWKVIFEMQ